jgi:hypothetical protein
MKPLPINPNTIPEMTVIFRHSAASFKLDNRIRYDAIYIKEPDLTDHKAAAETYYSDFVRASNAFKSFIVMNYNPFVGEYFSSLIAKPDTINFKNWIFLAFFHEENETLLIKHKKGADMVSLKTDILLSMQDHHFIKRYYLPLNHTLTFAEVLPILLEIWGYKY